MIKNIILVLVSQLVLTHVNASQPMNLKDYLKLECNIIDPTATGFVSEELVNDKACPERSSLFCENGFEQARNILAKEIKKTNVYADYVKEISVLRNIVSILGNDYLVVGNADLAPLENVFWDDSERDIEIERTATAVFYKLFDYNKEIQLEVDYDSETEACDFSNSQAKVVSTTL